MKENVSGCFFLNTVYNDNFLLYDDPELYSGYNVMGFCTRVIIKIDKKVA